MPENIRSFPCGFADVTQELWRMECCGYLASHATITENWLGITGGWGNSRLTVRKCPNPHCPTHELEVEEVGNG